jgi:hypothetical protein
MLSLLFSFLAGVANIPNHDESVTADALSIYFTTLQYGF